MTYQEFIIKVRGDIKTLYYEINCLKKQLIIKTSQLINDGEDGKESFITTSEVNILINNYKSNVIKYSNLIVFKIEENLNEEQQEVGDFCIGFVEGQFINANYLGGNQLLLTSYNI